MSSARAIVQYWKSQKENENNEFMIYEALEAKSCMACGSKSELARAHILPKCEGGTDTAENLHMLCKRCHLESEYLSGEVYRNWFHSMNPFSHADSLLRAFGVSWHKLINQPRETQERAIEILTDIKELSVVGVAEKLKKEDIDVLL